jgi:hypothetical protein
LIDNSELVSELAYAEEYCEYFDEPTLAAVQKGKEHLLIREHVNRGNVQSIIHCLNTCKCLTMDDDDFMNAMGYEEMLSNYESLLRVLDECGPKGPAGDVNFIDLSVDELDNAIAAMKRLAITEVEWNTVIEMGQFVLDLRLTLKTESENSRDLYPLAYDKMDLFSSSPTAAAASQSHCNGVKDVLARAVKEMELCRREIIHHRSIAKLLDLANQGKLRGSVGMLDMHGLDYFQLATELSSHLDSGVIVQSSSASGLLSDLKSIIQLRQALAEDAWERVDQFIHALYEERDHFSACHPSLQEELRLILEEVADRTFRQQLIEVYARGRLNLNDEEYGTIEAHTIDLDLIREAVMPGEPAAATTHSKATESIIFAGKYLYCLRYAAVHSLWEPVDVFPFGNWERESLFNICQQQYREDGGVAVVRELLQPAALNKDLKDRLVQSIQDLSQALCVSQLLNASSGLLEAEVRKTFEVELSSFRRLYVDRTCRILFEDSPARGHALGDMRSAKIIAHI